MADISFNCPTCQQHLEAPPDMAGEAFECPACKNAITIPHSPWSVQIKRPEQQKRNWNEASIVATAIGLACWKVCNAGFILSLAFMVIGFLLWAWISQFKLPRVVSLVLASLIVVVVVMLCAFSGRIIPGVLVKDNAAPIEQLIAAQIEQPMTDAFQKGGVITPAEQDRMTYLRDKSLSLLPTNEKESLTPLYEKPIAELTKEEYAKRLAGTQRALQLLSAEERKEFEILAMKFFKGTVRQK